MGRAGSLRSGGVPVPDERVLQAEGRPRSHGGDRSSGIARVPARALSILELACLVLYLIPATSVTGAILLTGYIGGALCTHLRVGDPFYVQIVLGLLVWLGLYLRDSRLKELVPVRTR